MSENFGTELRKLMKKYGIESIESPANVRSKIYISDEDSLLHVKGFKINGKNLKTEKVLGDVIYLIFNLEDQNNASV